MCAFSPKGGLAIGRFTGTFDVYDPIEFKNIWHVDTK